MFPSLHGVQSHCLPSFWRSEPLLTFNSVFKAIAYRSFRRSEPCFASFGVQGHYSPSFDVQSHYLSFSFGVQSHHRFLVWHSKSQSHIDVQSHHRIFVRCSEPSLISIGVRSHYYSSVWHLESYFRSAFRAITSFIPTFRAMFCFVWRSEPLLTFRSAFRVTSYHSILTFRATIIF